MTALQPESRHNGAAFETISTHYRTRADRVLVTRLAEVLARQTGARVQAPDNAPDAHAPPDVVVMSASDASTFARRVLDSGTSIVVVPTPPRAVTRIARLGIAYDGGKPADSALEAASALVAARPGEVEQVDVVYVDDSASGVGDAQDHVVNSRRPAVIGWWLERVAARVPAAVRVVRAAGDPADELAQLSEELDLLVVGTRGRAPLRRALTGSVSAKLIETTRCPLLVVPPKRPQEQHMTPPSMGTTTPPSHPGSNPDGGTGSGLGRLARWRSMDIGERWEAARPWPLVAPGYRSITAELDANARDVELGHPDRELVGS